MSPSPTATYGDLLGRHQVEIPAHLEAQAAIPVLDGTQRQGDLILIAQGDDGYVPPATSAEVNLVPAEGIAVIRGEAGGNTHLLVGEGPIEWAGTALQGAHLGNVTIPGGSTGYLLHPEHGAQGIAPGNYSVGRQREQAEEERLVAD